MFPPFSLALTDRRAVGRGIGQRLAFGGIIRSGNRSRSVMCYWP